QLPDRPVRTQGRRDDRLDAVGLVLHERFVIRADACLRPEPAALGAREDVGSSPARDDQRLDPARVRSVQHAGETVGRLAAPDLLGPPLEQAYLASDIVLVRESPNDVLQLGRAGVTGIAD